MSARVLQLPTRIESEHGVIHVMVDRVDGFEVGHESRSGNSWGHFSGPYRSGSDAVAAAYELNAREHGGLCEVFINDAAREDANPGVGLPSYPGEF